MFKAINILHCSLLLLLIFSGLVFSTPLYRVTEIAPESLPSPKSENIDLSVYSSQKVKELMADIIQTTPKGKITLQPVKGLVEMRALYSDEGLLRIGLKQKSLPEAIYIKGGLVTLSDIHKTYPKLLIKLGDNAFLSTRPIVIGIGATLIIENCILKLSEERGGCLINSGLLYLYGGELLGWRESADTPAFYSGDKSRYRPFFVGWGGSNTYFCKTKVAHLGYFKAKSFGITLSVYGVKKKEKIFQNSSFDFTLPPKGWFIDSTFSDIYYGFYCYEAKDVVIKNNTYINNIIYGIDPHDFSTGLIIANNNVYGTQKKHGIIISRYVTDSFIIGNKSHNNKIAGIMLDRKSIRNELYGNVVYQNGGDGISLYESGNNLIYGNTVIANKKHGIRLRNSENVLLINNVMINNGSFGLYFHTKDLSNTSRNLKIDPYEQVVSGRLYGGTISYNSSGSISLNNFEKFSLYDVLIENANHSKLKFGGDLRKYHTHAVKALSSKKLAICISKDSR